MFFRFRITFDFIWSQNWILSKKPLFELVSTSFDIIAVWFHVSNCPQAPCDEARSFDSREYHKCNCVGFKDSKAYWASMFLTRTSVPLKESSHTSMLQRYLEPKELFKKEAICQQVKNIGQTKTSTLTYMDNTLYIYMLPPPRGPTFQEVHA